MELSKDLETNDNENNNTVNQNNSAIEHQGGEHNIAINQQVYDDSHIHKLQTAIASTVLQPVMTSISKSDLIACSTQSMVKQILQTLNYSGLNESNVDFSCFPTDRAKWILKHPGVKKYLNKVFYFNPTPDDDKIDELTKEIFTLSNALDKAWGKTCRTMLRQYLTDKRFRLLKLFKIQAWIQIPNWEAKLVTLLSDFYEKKKKSKPLIKDGKFDFGAHFIAWVISGLKEEPTKKRKRSHDSESERRND